MAPANAAHPALIWTTVPPAKSNAPIFNKNPFGCHDQCAKGAYIKVINKTINKIYEVNLIRSATAPTTKPGVMMANIN